MGTFDQNLLGKYQSNVYPSMLEDLADDLGVKSSSLRRLALGWAPIVKFKKGESYCGWWTIPERDSEGTVLGLGLRNQGGHKTSFPGSKHGIIYEVNPHHQQGEQGFNPGPHNWVRTMDAGLLCPVCGKPDGCLLSKEDPKDPKAVICRSKVSERPMRFGFLHLRKESGILSGRSALIDGDGPVIGVEGMSDTATAMDLGFVGVGRPSNLAGLEYFADICRGRAVVIIGENDAKEDGKEPGREGMVAAFHVVSKVCSDVTMLMPPKHVKDLRAWKVKFGLTRELLLQEIKERGETKINNLVIADARPTTIARAFIGERYRLSNKTTLRHWDECWYEYLPNQGRYAHRKDSFVTQPLYTWAYDKVVQYENPKTGEVTLKPMSADPHFRNAIFEALMAETLVQQHQSPCWINGKAGPDANDLIVFNNGILNVTAFLRGDSDYLSDHTPDLFTTASLPIAFDPTAECPEWKKYLQTSLGDEQAKIDLAREWIGYCMTADTSLQKMMFLRGPTAAGKGIMLNVLEAIVGKEQTAWTRLSELSGQFGVAPLMGKLIALIGDARTPKHWDSMTGLEILLNITGNDSVSVNRKFKDQLAGQRLSARITIASNEFLEVPDHAGAMARRLNVIDFAVSHQNNPDTRLESKVLKELPGIAVWALEGLRRLRDTRAFTIPESSKIALQEWKTTTSPLAAFFEECLDQGVDYEIDKTMLFDAWAAWAMERRMAPTSKSRFFERIRTGASFVSSSVYEKNGRAFSMFRGIRLKPWAQKQFIGR